MVKTPKNPDRTKQQQRHWLDHAAVWAAGAAAFAAAAAAGVGAWQANISNQQLAVAKDTEQRQLRAYIGVSPDKIIQIRDGTWAIQIAAHNYGQTPARSVQINGGWELLDFPKSQEKVSAQHFLYARTEESAGIDVFPTRDGTSALPPFPADVVTKMRGYSGPLKIYAAGVVTYEDVFGNLWRTEYCAIITPQDFIEATDKPGIVISFDWCAKKYNHAT